MPSYYKSPPIPSAFILRKLHSLTGIGLVLFLIVHLFTNSQASFLVRGEGRSFIEAVNFLHKLPYFRMLEIAFLALPFLIHGIWGIKYLGTYEFNVFTSDGSKPSLPYYERNHAYTWQRITSWILIFGVLAHVVHMRFWQAPKEISIGSSSVYLSKITLDPQNTRLSHTLGFQIYPANQSSTHLLASILKDTHLFFAPSIQTEKILEESIQKFSFKQAEGIAISKNFGTAELLLLKETFQRPTLAFLYTLLVLFACYHAFNGLWTASITWGITLTATSQKWMKIFVFSLMALIIFLGIATIGTWLFY